MGRDREKVDTDFFTEMRPWRECLIFLPRRDLTQNSRRDRGQDRESLCVFLRDRDKNKLLVKKKTVNLARFCLKSTNPDQDKTEMRLSKIEATKTRRGQDSPKIFIRDETSSKILFDFSFETVTRPSLSSFTVLIHFSAWSKFSS